MTASSPVLAGHLLVDCLVAQGVTHAFGVPGESFLAVLDGFHAHRDRIRFVINRQEGGAAFMAEAVGKLTGRPGICFVTRGPGATQAAVGVHTAKQDSSPMLLLVGLLVLLFVAVVSAVCVGAFTSTEVGQQALMEQQRAKILQSDPSVTAFNVGINAGADAGQTIFHCHIHLIPRRKGDVEEPRGGVRGVIPAKQKY